MNFPKISIIIPSYNQGQFLEEAILSVINQQYPNLELFVIDGRSTDNSVDIIKKYESYITWWVSEKDKGQSEAINKGLAKATGEIISWLCSDDLLTDGALNTVYSQFSSADAKIGLIHGGSIVFGDKKKDESRFIYLQPGKEAYLSGMVFTQPAAFFRKIYLQKVGLLNGSLHYGMDYDLYMRLSLVCEFKPVNELLAKYRLHQQSKSIAESNKFINDWKRSFLSLCKNLSWKDELDLLRKTGLYEKEFTNSYEFSFEPDKNIVLNLNRKKVLFFHLGHVLKDLYWTHKIDKAKRLLRLLKENFPSEWAKEDTRLEAVIAKLKLPSLVIRSIRTIKRIIS